MNTLNPLALTAVVVLALLAFVGGCLALAWIYDRWMRRPRRREKTLQENLDSLGRSNTLQIILTTAIGLAAGAAYYAGWAADFCR